MIYQTRSHPEVIWIGTEGGLDKFNIEKQQFIHYQYDPDNSNSLCHNHVMALYKTPSEPGVLWIGTRHGLDRFDMEKEQFTHYRHNLNNPNSLIHDYIRAIYESPEEPGILWIGTFGGGLDKFNKANKKFTHYVYKIENSSSISDNFILNFWEDESKILWIGTEGGGINQYNRVSKQFLLYQHDPNNPNSLSINHVRSIYESPLDSTILWIGTYDGLNKWDRERGIFTCYNHDPKNPNSLSSNLIRVVYEDRSGLVWIGTYNGGLNQFDPKTGVFNHYRHDPDDSYSISNDYVRTLYQDRSGAIWIGAVGGGLDRFDNKNGRFYHYTYNPDDSTGINSDRVYAICEDKEGILWLGTSKGLNRFDRESETFTYYTHDPNDLTSIGNNLVMSVYKDRRGQLWIGTWGGGINRFDHQTEKFYRYTKKDGLANDVVYGILEDKQGNLWLSTNYGLSKFNPEKKTFKNYDVTDGLQSNEFNAGAYYQNIRGKMFFGGINGLNAFYPDKIRDNPYIPPIVINDFQISNQTVPIKSQDEEDVILSKSIIYTNAITLSYKEDVISFEYSALNYVSSEKNQYAYIMEGLDKEWNYVGERRFVTYTTLPPGEYTFRVKGSNCDRIWNEEGTFLKIIITPPFWQTWWFKIVAGLLLMAVVYFIFYLKTKSFKKREKKLQKTVQERTKKLEQANKNSKILKDEAQKKAVQSDLLYRIGQRVSSELETKSLFNEIVKSIRKTYNYFHVAILYLDENTEKIKLKAISSAEPEKHLKELTLSLGQGMIGQAVLTGKIKITGNVRKNPHYVRIKEETIQSELDIPLKSGNKVMGVLSIQSDKLNAFDKTDITVMEILSTQIVSAIENARLYEQTKRRAVQSAIIYKTGQRVGSQLEIDALLPEIVTSVCDEFDYYSVALLMINEKSDHLILKAIAGENAKFAPVSSKIRMGEGITGYVAQCGETQVSGDIRKNSHYVSFGKEKTKSELTVPLRSGKRIIGVLDIQSDTLNAFDKTDVTAMEILSTQIVSAIENARLYEQTKRRAAQTALIYEVGKRLSSNLNFKELLTTIVTTICEAFDYYGVMMLMYDEKYEYLTLQSITGGYVGTFPLDLRIAKGKGMIGQAAKTGKIQVSGDVSQDPHFVRKEKEKTKSELSVPIKLGDKVIGVLDIQSDKLHAFDNTDVTAMETLSTQIASAIENARLYEQAQYEISIRNKTEKELEKRKSYLESVLQNAPDAIVTMDKSHNIVDWNEGAEKIFGYKEKEVLGKNIDNLITSPDVKVESQGMTKQVLSGNKVPSRESIRYRKDGTSVNVIVAGSPIIIENKFHGIVAVYTDITKRKKAEKELSQKNKELETMDSVVKIINKKIDLENVLQSLLRQTLNFFPQAEKGSFLIYDEDMEKYRYAVVNGYNVKDVKNIHLTEKEVMDSYTEHSEQLDAGVYVIRNIKGLSTQNKLHRVETPKSMLAMSVILEGRLEGFLILDNMKDQDAFNKTDVQKLLRFREHAVSAFIRAKSLRLLEEKNKNILSSIRYGERIQNAILPLTKKIRSSLPQHFIIFKPRDIVSGDFYWFNQVDGKIVLAVIDCTGHGVPGAFMSMLGNAFLNQIVTEQKIMNPSLILKRLHEEVRTALKQKQEKVDTQDGMDVCLCVLEKNSHTQKLLFAGAKRPLFVFKKGESKLTEVKGDRKSIGGKQREEKQVFTSHEIKVQKGDQLYLTTDGFADQQNPKNKRYGSRRLKAFLQSVSELEMQEQEKVLAQELARHQGREEQRDDITVVVVKI